MSTKTQIQTPKSKSNPKPLSVISFITYICVICLFFSCLIFTIFISSCGDNSGKDELSGILKSYKKNGLTSWWEVVAIYNAGENPAGYKNFKDLYLSLEGTSNLKMAAYVTVANIAVAKGSNPQDFAKYEEYKSSLKNLLENPTGDYNLNDYIFGYLALKCSNMKFDEPPFFGYLNQSQKSDGGFAMSGDSGDVDMTAFAVQAMNLIYKYNNTTATYLSSTIDDALIFLENCINENGIFTSYDNENANSTACAISAFVGWYNDDGESNEIIKRAAAGLEMFKIDTKDKKETGYKYLKDGGVNALATAQAAITLGDLKNKTSVWEKLYNENNNNN